MRARPGIDAAIGRAHAKAAADRAAHAANLGSLMGAFTAASRTPASPKGTPEEREARRLARWSELLARSTPVERVKLIVAEARRGQPSGGELLLDVRTDVSADARQITLTHVLLAPAVMAEAIWSDPAVAQRERSLADAIHTALPDVELEATRETLCLVPAPGETSALAVALTHAGATVALGALGLSPAPPPAELEPYFDAQRSLLTQARFDLF